MATIPFFPRIQIPGDATVRPMLARASPFRNGMAGSWRFPCLIDAHRGLRMTLNAAAPMPVGPLGLRFADVNVGATLPITLSAAPYTIAVWYKSNAASATNRRVVQGVVTNWLMGPYAGTYQAYNGGFITGPLVTRFPVLHVITDDGTTMSQFMNGVAAGTRATSAHPGALAIGVGGSVEGADSDLANLTIWTRVLNTQEISQLPRNPDLLYRPRTYGFVVNTADPGGEMPWLYRSHTHTLGAGFTRTGL